VVGETLKEVVDSLQKRVGESGKVYLENIERLILSEHKQSSFDVILSGVVPQSLVVHSDELLAEFLRILKPKGILVIHEPTIVSGEHPILKMPSKLILSLKVNGFLNIDDHKSETKFDESIEQQVKEDYNLSTDFYILEVVCNKPEFEIGSNCLLNLKSSDGKVDSNTEKNLVFVNWRYD